MGKRKRPLCLRPKCYSGRIQPTPACLLPPTCCPCVSPRPWTRSPRRPSLLTRATMGSSLDDKAASNHPPGSPWSLSPLPRGLSLTRSRSARRSHGHASVVCAPDKLPAAGDCARSTARDACIDCVDELELGTTTATGSSHLQPQIAAVPPHRFAFAAAPNLSRAFRVPLGEHHDKNPSPSCSFCCCC